MKDGWEGTLITILLVLATLAWAAWNFYGQYWWRARKWEEERRRDLVLSRLEDRKARELASLKFEKAAYSVDALQKRAEQLRRQRTGENLIYESAIDKQDEICRRLAKRRFRTNNTTDLS